MGTVLRATRAGQKTWLIFALSSYFVFLALHCWKAPIKLFRKKFPSRYVFSGRRRCFPTLGCCHLWLAVFTLFWMLLYFPRSGNDNSESIIFDIWPTQSTSFGCDSTLLRPRNVGFQVDRRNLESPINIELPHNTDNLPFSNLSRMIEALFIIQMNRNRLKPLTSFSTLLSPPHASLHNVQSTPFYLTYPPLNLQTNRLWNDAPDKFQREWPSAFPLAHAHGREKNYNNKHPYASDDQLNCNEPWNCR